MVIIVKVKDIVLFLKVIVNNIKIHINTIIYIICIILGTEDWRSYFTTYFKRLNNKCHTLQRFTCYEDLTEQQYRDESKYAGKSVNAHLFYNSVPCSRTISAIFTKVSSILLILTLFAYLL